MGEVRIKQSETDENKEPIVRSLFYFCFQKDVDISFSTATGWVSKIIPADKNGARPYPTTHNSVYLVSHSGTSVVAETPMGLKKWTILKDSYRVAVYDYFSHFAQDGWELIWHRKRPGLFPLDDSIVPSDVSPRFIDRGPYVVENLPKHGLDNC
jgi:hypothetical protein